MRRGIASIGVAGTGIAVALATVPLVAAGADSSADALIGSLSETLIVLGLTVAFLVEGALLFVILRYRESGEPQETRENYRFLLAWVLAIGLILLFVGFASFQTLAALGQQGSASTPEDAMQVNVTAEQWLWTFEYPEEGTTSRQTLVIPVNETIHLRITSEDVIHSFHAPDLGLKQDAIPAQRNSVTFTPTNTGEYRLFCAEYCGRGHSRMLGTVRVVDATEYDRWVEGRIGNSTAG